MVMGFGSDMSDENMRDFKFSSVEVTDSDGNKATAFRFTGLQAKGVYVAAVLLAFETLTILGDMYDQGNLTDQVKANEEIRSTLRKRLAERGFPEQIEDYVMSVSADIVNRIVTSQDFSFFAVMQVAVQDPEQEK